MNKKIVSIILFFLLITSVSGELISEKSLIFRGRKLVFGVETGNFGTDIFVNIDRKRSVSTSISGENLFPKVFPQKESFNITWINYLKNDVKLVFYNSLSDIDRIIIPGGYRFISGETEMIFRGGEPSFVLFRGIRKSDNEDIYIIDLMRNRVEKITDTRGNEKNIIVRNRDIGNGNILEIETETLYKKYVYRVDLLDLSVKKISESLIIRPGDKKRPKFDKESFNTIIAFGDSITWGKMRMNDLVGEYHPELTYWYKASEYLTENFGQTYTVNLGVNADSSQKGVNRMDSDLRGISGYYFLVLFGTNDVVSGSFSSESTRENLEWIMMNARNRYGMFPIISTVPPQKKFLPGVQFYKDETEELNAQIILMATEDGFPFIDSYSAFMNYKYGWEALLEDIKGNHPNPTGHQIMADLVVPEILAAKPARPEILGITEHLNSIEINCSENYEFDFDSYDVSFGYSEDNLEFNAKFPSNKFSLIRFPVDFNFRGTVYFKVRSIDKSGYSSGFTGIYSSGFGK